MRPLWRNFNFILVWGGQSVSLLGSQFTYIALLWWVLEKTGSAAVLASVAIASSLPSILLGPFAGAFIDRLDRRKLMIGMDLANGLIIGGAATLLFLGRLAVWQIYIFSLLSATATLFHRPALQASIPNLVEPEQLTKANSLYQISAGSAGIAGPAIGGMLVGLLGSGPTMWLDAITFVVAGISLILSSFPSPRKEGVASFKAVLSDAIFGFKFLYHKRALFFVIFLFALVNFFLAPMNVLLPVMAKEVLHAGAQGFGLLGTAISAGMLIGGFVASRLKRFKRYGLGIIWGIVTLGAVLTVFGFSRNLLLSMGALAVVGGAAAIANILSTVVFQTYVPNELQGRIFAADHAISNSLQPISLAAVGGILTLISAPILILAGGIAVAIAGLGGYLVEGMKEL